MLIIIFGILTLVYASKYKSYPLVNKMSKIRIFSIVTTVLVVVQAFSLLSYVTVFSTGTSFVEEIIAETFKEMEFESNYITLILDDISSFVSIIMWTSLIIDLAAFVFGLVALIMGFSTLNNPQLKAKAQENTAAIFLGPQQSYSYSQQAPSYAESTQSFSTSTAPAPDVSQPQNWFCASCGASNISMANFCGSCGNKRQ